MSVSLARPSTVAHLYTTDSELPYVWLPISEIDDDRVVEFTVHTLTEQAIAAGLTPTHVALTHKGHLVRHIALQTV